MSGDVRQELAALVPRLRDLFYDEPIGSPGRAFVVALDAVLDEWRDETTTETTPGREPNNGNQQ